MNRHVVDGEALPISAGTFARRWKTLAVLSLALIIIGLDNTILNVALPTLQSEFDASSSTLQCMVDSYLLVFAGLLLTMGTLGDRFGRKLALQAGLAIFGAASVAVLFVDGPNGLIAVRAAMGVGGALIMPATLSTITNIFPRAERGKAIGIWAAMAAVGIGLGPLIGGLLLEWFSWESVFLVNVPVAALAFLMAIALFPETRDPTPGRFDLLGAGLSIAALGTLVYGLIEAPERGWGDPLILASFGLAAVLTAGFVAWELRTPEPMLNMSFFANRRFSIPSLAIGIQFFALFGSIFAMTQYLQYAHGYSALEAGAVMSPLALGLIAGARSGTKIAAHKGTSRIVAAGLAGTGCLLVTALAWSPDMSPWLLSAWFVAVAVCMGWVMAPATTAVMGAVPPEKAGVASAMNDVTRQVGGSLGTAVIGSLIATLYTAGMDEDVAGLPEPARGAAEESVGQAHAVASSLGGAQGEALSGSAASTFTDAIGIGFAAAGVCALLGAVLVARRLPRRAERVAEESAAPAGAMPERVA